MAKQRPNDRKQQIVAAAAYLFSERGYNATTMRELATQVGMEASSIYNHFASKQALLQHICFEVGYTFEKRLKLIIDNQNHTAAQRLRAGIEAHILQLATNQHATAVANEEWRYLEQPFLDTYQHLRRSYEQQLTNLISEAISENCQVQLPPRAILLTVLSAAAWIQRSHNTAKQTKPQVLSSEITDWLMRGLLHLTV